MTADAFRAKRRESLLAEADLAETEARILRLQFRDIDAAELEAEAARLRAMAAELESADDH